MAVCIEKGSVVRDIREHLLTHGSRNWGPLRAKHFAVSEPTFWRWIRQVKAEVRGAQLWVPARRDAVENTHAAALDRASDLNGADLPSVPASTSRVDYAAVLRRQFDDVRALRASALNLDGTVKNPVALDRSIGIGIRLLSKAMKLERQIGAVQQMRRLSDAVLAEVGQASPDIQRRVIDRLSRLQQAG